MGGNGFLGKLRRYAGRLRGMEVSVHASHACYFMVLSLFPALTLVLSLLRYTALEPRDLMELARGYLPDALEPYIWNLISGTYESTSRMVVSVSAAVTLWSASRGVYGLMNGLNGVYGRQEKRSWLHTRLMCAAYTVLFVLMLILTLVLHVFGSTISRWIESAGDPRFFRWAGLIDLSFFVLLAAQTLLFGAMFAFLPEGGNGFRESLPGALVGSLGWTVFSSLFSVYVEHTAGHTGIYGSVYALVLAMLWLYMCVSILFYGGALNCFLADQE